MNPIGFSAVSKLIGGPQEDTQKAKEEAAIKPSIVQVFFLDRNRTLAYYNDRFDLHVGDLVFVDGKLEGLQGRVTDVSTHFKIKLEDYKRVIGVADTYVVGRFYQTDTHFITFAPSALTWKQFCSWVKPPDKDGTEYYVSYDEKGILLDDFQGLDVDESIFYRGVDYFRSAQVQYLCLDAGKGRAVVMGTKPYEVEFQYQDGEVRNLFCDCPCGYTCKHDVAVLLQLREALEVMEKNYAGEWEAKGYFAMIAKPVFYRFAIHANSNAILELH